MDTRMRFSCVPKFIPLFATHTQLSKRKPWKMLIKNFEDTFFAKPILCEMHEFVDDLDNTQKICKSMEEEPTLPKEFLSSLSSYVPNRADVVGKDVFKERAKHRDREIKKANRNNKKNSKANKTNPKPTAASC